MTMHLVRGMTSLRTKKRKKSALTQNQRTEWHAKWKAYNKDMRRSGLPNLQLTTFEDYVRYRRGLKPKGKYKGVAIKTETYQRTSPDYKSNHNIAGVGSKKQETFYTGKRKLVGIATMHKSNMVPVFADEENDKSGIKKATELATMRRN